MSYYVAKKLSLDPEEIMSWSPAKLVVTFGQYANEASYKEFETWRNLSSEQKKKTKQPPKYAVLFREISEFVEEGGE
jgi:hypothetical protein